MRKIFFKYKYLSFTTIIFILLGNLASIFSSLSLSKLLNSVLSGNVTLVIQSIIIVLGLSIIGFGCELLYATLQSKLAEKVNSDIRLEVANSISNMSQEEYEKNEIGTYISWFTNDITEIENHAIRPIFSMISNIFILILVISVFIKLHYSLVITAIIAATVLMLSPRLFSNKISDLSIKQSKGQENFTKDMKDILSGFEVMKLYNSLDTFNNKINSISCSLERNRFNLAFFRNRSNALLYTINMSAQLSCIFVSAYLAATGKVEYGALLAVGNLSSLCFNAIRMISVDKLTLSGGRIIFNKLENLKTYIRSTEVKHSLETFSDSIKVNNLSFSYGENKVIDNLSITFEKGKKYALIGPSGCGKSTLLKLLMGNITKFKGNILIDNKNIKNLDIKSVYNKFAYIDQNCYLFNSSIKDNITVFSDKYHDAEIEMALKQSALYDFVHEQSLDLIVGESGNNISGGQKQRVAIARALLNKKSVIIMDEGTSALDKKNSSIVEKKLLENPNVTLILVTHNINEELAHMFDDIYNLSELNKLTRNKALI